MASRWTDPRGGSEELEAFSPFADSGVAGEQESPDVTYEEEQVTPAGARWRSPFLPFATETDAEASFEPVNEDSVEEFEWRDEEDYTSDESYAGDEAGVALEQEDEREVLEHGMDRQYEDQADVALAHEHVCRECGQGFEALAHEDATHEAYDQEGAEGSSESGFTGEDVERSYESGMLAESEFLAEADAESPFGIAEPEFEDEVDAATDAGVSALAREWSDRRGGKPDVAAMKAWLLNELNDTLLGASRRGDTSKLSPAAVTAAWLISYREWMEFQLAPSVPEALPAPRQLVLPATRADLVPSEHVSSSKTYPVAPVTHQFMAALKARVPGVTADNYSWKHGSDGFQGRGYSLDLRIDAPLDSRGFYRSKDAIDFLHALNAAASAANVMWRVIYNDSTVARAINGALRRRHVIYVGKPSRADGKVTGLVWHGPRPLLLHFHLDIAPRTGAPSDTPASNATGTGATPAPVAAPPGAPPTSATVRFAQQVLNASERERLTVDGDLGPKTRDALERFRKRYAIGAGGLLDERTDLALVQRALEELAQQSMFARPGVRDAATDAAIIRFRAQHVVGLGPAIDAPLRAALAAALAHRGGTSPTSPTSPASPAAPPRAAPAPTAMPSGSGAVTVHAGTVAAVERYRGLAEAAGVKHGVDPALVLGVIAAESGGRADLVARSGYTGLMQSDRSAAHKDPRTSIEAGTKKLADFRKIMEGILAQHGQRYDQLPAAEQLRLLALAYNAGPVTVAKALQYAATAGSAERWLDAEHYRRALDFTGAYSVATAAPTCMPGASAAERQARTREAEALRHARRFGTKKVSWRTATDPSPWAEVMPKLPPLAACAIGFKHERSPGYAARILAYAERFRSR